jgi:hypothetical protein
MNLKPVQTRRIQSDKQQQQTQQKLQDEVRGRDRGIRRSVTDSLSENCRKAPVSEKKRKLITTLSLAFTGSIRMCPLQSTVPGI